MWTIITSFFGSAKNIIITILTLFIGGYVAKAKYDEHVAEEELEDLQNGIDKANVEITKEQAEAEAKAKELETSTEIDTLREIVKEKEKVDAEMTEIEKVIDESGKDKTEVTDRKRGEKFKIEI